jgi:protein-lysine N-methyltransferase EEF2KMT
VTGSVICSIADGQTYDATLFPLLVSTLVMLLEGSPSLAILIAATIRNEQTYEDFISRCSELIAADLQLLIMVGLAQLVARDIGFSPCAESEQTGPFYSIEIPMRIIQIERR